MKIRLDENNIKWGITAFLVILASILVYFAMLRLQAVTGFLDATLGILSPFICGFVIAYLLCPIYNGCVRWAYAKFNKGDKVIKKDLFLSKVFGTIVSLSVFIFAVAAVIYMILPGLMESIVNVVEMLPAGKNVFLHWFDTRLDKFPIAEEYIAGVINDSADNLLKFFTETFLPEYGNIAAGISSGILGAVNLVKNLFIGIIVSVYFLNSKDVFAAQSKKVIFALCKEKRANGILELARFTNKSFGGFISGKIIDSIIIGIICFIVMSIMGWEYSLLISCIIGITNIIPFFGPFIGAIPSMLLLIMVSPMHALYFGIFVILLQQFDGNILGPKILGDSTGLESFWVLFAVLVGGGLFGFVGMIVGIPVFAVIYFYGTKFINARLEKKGFSTSLTDYKVDSYRTIERPDAEPKGIMKLFKHAKAQSQKESSKDKDNE